MHKAIDGLLKTRHRMVRIYLKLIRVPEYKSKSDYWPWVKISSLEENKYSIFYSGSFVCTTFPFSDFNETVGDIAIIGSGPSVNMMCFDKISKMNCVLLNGSIALINTYNIKPLACVIVDSTFVENRFEILRCLPSGTNLILTPGVIRAISERDPAFLSEMKVYLTQNILSPVYNPGERFQEQRNMAQQANFSFDLDCGYIDGGTVMSVAIQLAYQVKANNTYLVGLDISNFSSPRFYETERNKLKCGLANDYESSILPFMNAASVLYDKSRKPIYNCSSVSKLPYEIFPYCSDFTK